LLIEQAAAGVALPADPFDASTSKKARRTPFL
jgi:hypothetical protein